MTGVKVSSEIKKKVHLIISRVKARTGGATSGVEYFSEEYLEDILNKAIEIAGVEKIEVALVVDEKERQREEREKQKVLCIKITRLSASEYSIIRKRLKKRLFALVEHTHCNISVEDEKGVNIRRKDEW